MSFFRISLGLIQIIPRRIEGILIGKIRLFSPHLPYTQKICKHPNSPLKKTSGKIVCTRVIGSVVLDIFFLFRNNF